jgi:hypothetical protein
MVGLGRIANYIREPVRSSVEAQSLAGNLSYKDHQKIVQPQ